MKRQGINPEMVTSGTINTAIGMDALATVVTGNDNIAIGFQECRDVSAYSPMGYRKRSKPFRSSFRPAVDPLKNTDRNRLNEFEEVKKLDEVVRTFD